MKPCDRNATIAAWLSIVVPGLIVIAALLLSARANADVCLDLTCSQSKPLAQMQASDTVYWCDGTVTGGVCPAVKTSTWSQMATWTKILTDSGYYTKDKIPIAAFVPIPAKCFPAPIGSGTKYIWEAIVPGDSRYSKPSMIVWACVINDQYVRVTYAGTLANHIEDIIDGIARAMMGDITKLSALSVSLVTRPLSAAEDTRKLELWASLNLPVLTPVIPLPVEVWKVKPILGATSRTAYKLLSGALSSIVGKAEVGKLCDCTLKFTNTSSTYCGVAGLPNVGTTKVLPADAVTICTK